MPRRSKDAAIDLSSPHDLTAGLIEALTSQGKAQAFLRDTKAPGLRVRVTAAGAKSYVFEAKVKAEGADQTSRTLRQTIGDVRTWTIEAARAEANRLRVLVDQGNDPRELERQKAAAAAAAAAQRAHEAAQDAAKAVTVREAWTRYMAEGSPKRREAWKPRYVADMVKMTAPGGEDKKRGKGKTLPGHLTPLLDLTLMEVDEDRLSAWFETERRRSKHQATRALMMFRGFLRWASTRPEFRKMVNRDAGKAPVIMDNLPPMKRRTDALEAAQVAGWWSAVEQLPNPVASVYLRALLLTGARREEMAGLRWEDVDFRWRKLTIADKVDETRTIPLSDYMAEMLAALPRRKGSDGKLSPFVFASSSKSGRLADPRSSHERAQTEAGLQGLTLHGLRRSFSLLGEAAGAPAGAIAQVMGHRPSATAEGYRPRSIEALRPYLAQIERFILDRAGVKFEPKAQGLHAVSAA
jgi:integrase